MAALAPPLASENDMKVANASFRRGETTEAEAEVNKMPYQRERAPAVFKQISTVVNGVPVYVRVRRDNRLDISFNRGKPRFLSQAEAIDFLNGLKCLINDTFKQGVDY
jgi:hypothetical protein